MTKSKFYIRIHFSFGVGLVAELNSCSFNSSLAGCSPKRFAQLLNISSESSCSKNDSSSFLFNLKRIKIRK